VGKQAVSADQTRSTRDILHLIQHRATDECTVAVSTTSTCTASTKTAVSNGLRQFQERPQLFEAITMPTASTDSVNGHAENDLALAQPEQSVTGWFLCV